jgi:AcrR family transcriptional regulator
MEGTMAKRGTRAGRGRSAAGSPAEPADTHGTIIDALMALLATRDFSEIGLADVAKEAGVSLSTLRATYDGKIGIVADFSRRIDQAVLDGGPAEGDEARDRLFEIMMRRFDALAPYRASVRRLARSARRDIGLACALNRISRSAQMWMLVAAGIHHGGLMGRIAIQGAVLVYADVLRVWFDDDDPGQARTMAALDRALRRGEQAMKWIDGACAIIPSFAERGRRARDAGRAGAAA